MNTRQLTNAEAVRLFFAARPGVSDEVVAKQTGIPESLINAFRHEASRTPFRRELARKAICEMGTFAILAAITERVRRCPNCAGSLSVGWGRDRAGKPRRRCKTCSNTFTTARRPFRIDDRSVEALIDAVAAGLPLRAAYSRAGIAKMTGEKIVSWLLTQVAEVPPGQWRTVGARKDAK